MASDLKQYHSDRMCTLENHRKTVHTKIGPGVERSLPKQSSSGTSVIQDNLAPLGLKVFLFLFQLE